MKPPSRLASGQSSASAASSWPRRSGHRSISASNWFKQRALPGRQLGLQRRQRRAACGPRKLRSRGLARPVVTRASSRSHVVDPPQQSRAARRPGPASATSSPTASCRATIAGRIDQRIGQPIGQQPRAHGRDRAVQHGQQRALAAALADGAGDFQAAAAGLVDLQRAGGAVGHQPVDMRQRGLLRFVQIIEHGAGGADRLVVGRAVARSRSLPGPPCRSAWPASAAAVSSEKAQAGRRVTIIRSSSCRGSGAASSASRHSAGAMRASWSANCAGGKTGGHEPARGQLDPGQPSRLARRATAARKVARARIQQGVVGDGAGRDDPRHLALDQPLGQLGVFDLLADGGPQAGGDQLAQVAFQLMVGKAGHGDGVGALCRGWSGPGSARGRPSWRRRRTVS